MKDLELLESYILQKLDAVQQAAVNKRLKEDFSFAQEHEKLSLVAETVKRNQTREKIKAIQQQKMEEWSSEKVLELTPPKRSFVFIYKIASLAAAASIITALYLGNADFALPDNIALQERGVFEDNTTPENGVSFKYLGAQEALAAGQYQDAANAFEDLKENELLNAYYQDAAQWFEIVAQSELDEAKASDLFRTINLESDLVYPLSWIEKLKMRLRLMF